MPNDTITKPRRKEDRVRLTWSSESRRAPNPEDIDFKTAEILIPTPQRDQLTIAQFRKLAEAEIDNMKMNWLINLHRFGSSLSCPNKRSEVKR